MDPQTMLRIMSLFGGAPQESNTAQPMMQQPIMQPSPFTGAGMPTGQMSAPPRPDYDPYSRMKELYQPRTDISSAYTNSLMNMPQRQPVGVPRGLAAIASSFLLGTHNPALGMQTGDQVAHGPYYQELGDWQNKTSALGKGAAEEDRYNTNQRQLAEQTIGKELLDRKQEETNRKDLVSEEQKNRALDLKEKRDNAYIFKTTHPDWKPAQTKGGTLILYNPKDPTETIDTKIPTGTLTDYDKIHFQVQGRLQEIEAQGKNQSSNISQRGQIQFGLQSERDKAAMDRKLVPAGGTSGRPLLPTQEKARIFNRAQQATIEHPEWKPFIELYPGNVVKVAPGTSPSSWNPFSSPTGPDPKTAKAINDYIYGGGGTVRMTGPDGKGYDIPANKIEQAKKDGLR